MGSLFDDIADDPVPFPSQANPQPEGAPSPAQFARAPQSQEDSAQSTDDGISSYVPNYLKESARSLYEGPRERLTGLAGEFQNSRLSGQTAAGIGALLDPIPAVSQGTANAGSIADAANRVYNDYRNAIMGTQGSAPFKYSWAEDAQKERFARENPETAQTIGAVMEGQLSHPYGVMGAPRDVAPIAKRTGKAIAENAPDATQLNSLGGPKAKTSLGSLFADIPDEPPHDTDPLGYYSAALEAANSLKQAKGTPEQMLAQLRKGGAKDAEIAATGLDQFLTDKKSVTKQDIATFLEENRVGLNEVTYQGKPKNDVDELYGQLAPQYGGQTNLPNAKWQSYSLDPDNPSYRETVLHLPSNETANDRTTMAKINEFMRQRTAAVDDGDFDRVDEIDGRIQELDPTGVLFDRVHEGPWVGSASAEDFQSGHFPEPNITGHMMTSLVKDEQGKPVFLVDQIQSDWGQRLRDAGGARDEAKIAGLRKKSSDAANEFEVLLDQGRKLLGRNSASYWDTVEAIAKSKDDNAIALGHRLADAHSTSMLLNAELRTAEETPSGHPLVNTTSQWVTTTLRRAINQAIEAGADKIAIPTGDTVLSYNPGDKHGMNEFYNKIVPLALKKIMRGHDAAYPEPARVEKLETPTKGPAGEGFTVFPITDAVKESAKRGQPLFARGGQVKKSSIHLRAAGGKIKHHSASPYVQGLLRKYAPLN